MRRLLTGYVIGFNRRHGRSGQLFQNRYKSIVCQEETYLRELVGYIHLNPVRAGMVEGLDELKRYKFCGHSALMGKVKREWQDTGYVLGYFGKRESEARKKYESFVKEGVARGRREELTGGGLIRSLGGWTAARDALKGYDLDRVVQRVSEVLGMKPEDIFSKGRQNRKVTARSLMCFWAARELGISHTALAKELEMSLAGVGFSVERGESIARKAIIHLIHK